MKREVSAKCIVGATLDVVDKCKMVRIMIRLPEQDGTVHGLDDGEWTGWLLMHGPNDVIDGSAMYWMERVLPQNPHIEPVLDTPAPCRFDWCDHQNEFVRTE